MQREAGNMTNVITREDLQDRMTQDGFVLLEALPPSYYDDGHLPGAKNLPLDAIDSAPSQLIPENASVIVTYCSGPSCSNSRIAAERLVRLGYDNVYAYEGGKEDWTNAGLKLEKSVTALPA
jgi:rhodanese-related sulfurtransferase